MGASEGGDPGRGRHGRSVARQAGGSILPRVLQALLLLPLYVFCGEHLLCARLRSADRGAAHGVVAELQRIVTRLREAWPQVRITVRGDSGFHQRMVWCEKEGVDYVLGLAKNDRLKKWIRSEVVRQLQQAMGKAMAAVPGTPLPDSERRVVATLARAREPEVHRIRCRWTNAMGARWRKSTAPGETWKTDQGAAVGSVCGPDLVETDRGQSTAFVFFGVCIPDGAHVGAGRDEAGAGPGPMKLQGLVPPAWLSFSCMSL